MTLRILALIPARSGSKRLPGKNIKELGGYPLIYWTIRAALDAEIFCDVLVSTDDHAIKNLSEIYGAKVPWLRPQELSTDNASSVDVALHAIECYEKQSGAIDALVLLQPTSPFRNKELIIDAINLFKETNKPVVVVHDLQDEAHLIYCNDNSSMIPISNLLPKIISKENCQDLCRISGSLYVISPSALRKSRSFTPENFLPLMTKSQITSIDIDNYEDWTIAEGIVGKILNDSKFIIKKD
jgi:CMP-N-acetylneuraminic acid synthetase